ncbi:MAG: hypothetical protein HQL82_01820 [Magnetococcales bacterium]|nr:hypothetical protein [Magnetococcales bacterium]
MTHLPPRLPFPILLPLLLAGCLPDPYPPVPLAADPPLAREEALAVVRQSLWHAPYPGKMPCQGVTEQGVTLQQGGVTLPFAQSKLFAYIKARTPDGIFLEVQSLEFDNAKRTYYGGQRCTLSFISARGDPRFNPVLAAAEADRLAALKRIVTALVSLGARL